MEFTRSYSKLKKIIMQQSLNLKKKSMRYAEKFKGKITDAASVNEALKGYLAIFEKIVPVGTYTSLAYQYRPNE